MTMVQVVRPVYEIRCERAFCRMRFRSDTQSYYTVGTRREAIEAGWSLRPLLGKGSRSAPDLCPFHADGGR